MSNWFLIIVVLHYDLTVMRSLIYNMNSWSINAWLRDNPGKFLSTARIAGIAEDGSKMTLEACSINSSTIGLAAYRNTPGYGTGMIVTENVLLVNTQIPYLSEEGSSISAESSAVPASPSPVFPQIKAIAGILA